MANTAIKFYKQASAPTAAAGSIWFNTTNRTIQVYTGTEWEVYTGLIDATYTNNILTITKAQGGSLQLDLSDVASAEALATLTTTVTNLSTTVTDNKTAADKGIKEAKDAAATVATDLAEYETANDAAVQGVANDLSEYETSNDARVEAVEGRVGTLETTVGEHDAAIEALQGAVGEGGSVSTQINAAIDALAGSASDEGTYVDVAVTTENGEVKTVTVDDSALVTKVNELNTAISDEATARTTAITGINSMIGGSYSASATVADDIQAAKNAAAAAQADIDAFFTAAETGTEALDTLKEIQDWIASDETGTTELINRVAANETAIDTLEAKVDVTKVSTAIATAKSEILGTLGTDDAATLAAINDELDALDTNLKAYADQAEADALASAKSYADGLAGNYDAAGSAAAAQAAAKEYSDGLNTAMNTRVEALEAIDHDAYKAYADQVETDAKTAAQEYATTAETNAKSYADTAIAAALVWAEFE